MSYSPALQYYTEKLAAFSTNTFRLEAQNSTSASPNQIIRFTLPSNALLNLRSFSFFFNMTTSSASGGIARFGGSTSSLIERVEVTAGGVQLSAGNNYYNVLCAAKRALTDKMVDPVLSHSEMVRNVSFVDGATFAGNEVYTGSNALFCVNQWEGFLGSCEPKIFDSSLINDLVISITLADTSVLSNSAGVDLPGTLTTGIDLNGSGTVSYALSNIHATIECCSLNDGILDNITQSIIASKGYLEIPYKEYYSFQDNHSGAMKWSVATNSLDRIWIVPRDAAYNSSVGARSVRGYKKAGAYVHKSTALVDGVVTASTALDIDNLTGAAPVVGDVVNGNGVAAGVTIAVVVSPTSYILSSAQTIADNAFLTFGSKDVGLPEFDIGGSLDYNKEKLVTAALNFPESASSSSNLYSLTLNGAQIPQFRATFEEMYQMSMNSLPMKSQNFFVLGNF